jgi:hypothetical protein
MPHDDSFGGKSLGWQFGEYMGMVGDPILCDLEEEVTSQFRVVHCDGDVAGKPIDMGSDSEGEMPTIWSMENARGQRWREVPQIVCTHR